MSIPEEDIRLAWLLETHGLLQLLEQNDITHQAVADLLLEEGLIDVDEYYPETKPRYVRDEEEWV